MPGHSVLEVTIGGQSYMLDATGLDTIVPIDYREQVGDTTRMVIDGYGEKYVRVSDAEQMLISQIYHNAALDGDSPSSKLVLLDKALVHTPNYTDIHFSQGLAYYSLDRYEEAMQSFIKALEKDPSDIDSYVYLARILLELGRPEEAYQVIETILSDQPSHEDLLAMKAELLLELGQSQEAVGIMVRVLRVNPGNLTILLGAGGLLGDNGREDLGYVFYYVFDKVTGRQSNYPIDEHYKNTIDALYNEGDVYASGKYLADLLVSSQI